MGIVIIFISFPTFRGGVQMTVGLSDRSGGKVGEALWGLSRLYVGGGVGEGGWDSMYMCMWFFSFL